MKKVLREILGVFSGWWAHDRIRIAPTEGRLLSLRPGCRFVVRSQCFIVVDFADTKRFSDSHDNRVRVCYELQGPDGIAKLTVVAYRPFNQSCVSGRLETHQDEIELSNDEIAILSPYPNRKRVTDAS